MLMKKTLAVFLAVAISVPFLSACAQKEDGKAAEGTPSAQTASQSAADGGNSLPIVNKPITIKALGAAKADTVSVAKTFSEVACFKELEKLTGIKIEWQHPPVGQEEQVVNLAVASGDMPDFIWGGINTDLLSKLANNGSIVNLKDYLDKFDSNFMKVLNKYDQAKKQALNDDGSIYAFPMMRIKEFEDGSQGWFSIYGPMIRKDWLDNLGLKEPETIDELHTVLKAFKEKDANKNGDPNDEIPFIAQKNLDFLSSAWGFFDSSADGYSYVDNGKVNLSFLSPACRDYVATMHQWYEEGLLDKDYLTTDNKAFEAMITSDKAGFYYTYNAFIVNFYNTAKDKIPGFAIKALPWSTGPAGKSYSGSRDDIAMVFSGGTVVSSKSRYIDEIVRMLDYVYSDEGTRLFNYGIENESYVMENGKPKYTDIVMKNPDGLTINQALCKYSMAVGNFSMTKDPDYFEQITFVIPPQRESHEIWSQADKSLFYPQRASFTTEETNKMTKLQNDINTYWNEIFSKMVVGVEPVENFDKHVEALKKMGADELIQIRQAAYDRYMNR